MIKQRETNSWKSVSYAKSITGAQTYTKFPIVLRTTEQSIPTWNVKGNMVQDGTPTPSNPVDVNGVGVRTENLFNELYPNITTSVTRITLYVPNGDYTMSTPDFPVVTGASVFLMITGETAVTNINGVFGGHPVTQTVTDGMLVIGYRINNNRNPTDYHFMLNVGSTALPYEPYGYKIPVISGGVTTNIYLGSTQTVRQIKKVVLTGNESGWTMGVSQFGKRFGYALTSPMESTIDMVRSVCSHVPLTYSGGTYSNPNTYTIGSNQVFNISLDASYTTLDQFLDWLKAQYSAGTPVTVWYVLTTPETAAVNEPLMKIGTYADTLSNTVSIPTTSGLNTIDVAAMLKPSEMSLTYDGYKLCKGQRYSRTENLWNEDYTDISSDVTYKPVYVGDGTFTLSTTCPRSSDPAPCLFFLSGNVDSGASSAVNGVWNEFNGIQNSQNGYVTIAYRKLGITNPENYDTMLNAGSTAKPYQPYLDWE